MIKNSKTLSVGLFFVGLFMFATHAYAQGTFSPSATVKFSAGVKVKTTSNLNIRLTASLYSQQVGIQNAGAEATVIAGPIVANGYTWWKYDFATGADGWAVDTYVSDVTSATGSSGSSSQGQSGTSANNVKKFQNGDTVQTTARVNVRGGPGIGSTSLGLQESGAVGTIIAEQNAIVPVYTGGYYWWRVNFSSGVSGWVVENYLVKGGNTNQVTPPPTNNLPTVSISASPNPVTSAQSFMLSWSSTGAVSCVASGGWSGSKVTGGSQTLTAPTVSGAYPSIISYILDCKNSAGQMGSSKIDLTINPQSISTNNPINSNPNSTSKKFQNGDTVQTTARVNVRGGPGIGSTSLGLQESGAVGTIIAEQNAIVPVYTGGYYWWRVNFSSGVSGWVVENYLVKANVSLPPSVPPTNPPAPPVSLVDLKANGSDGPITIPHNTSATLSWSGSSTLTDCSIVFQGGVTKWLVSASGSRSTGNLTQTEFIHLYCNNDTVHDLVIVNVAPVNTTPAPTPSVDLKANGQDSLNITVNSPFTLTYVLKNISPSIPGTQTAICTASGGTGNWPGVRYAYTNVGNYPLTVSTAGTYTFTITCGAATDSTTVTVNNIVGAPLPPASVDIKASLDGSTFSDGPLTMSQTQTLTLKWNIPTSISYLNCKITGAPVVLYPGSQTGTYNGYQLTLPSTSGTTYTLDCGTSTDSVKVTTAYSAPVVTISADKNPVNPGNSVKLSWSSTGNPTYCQSSSVPGVNAWQTVQPTSGSLTLNNQLVTTTYTLTCYNSAGQSGVNSVTVIASPTTADLKANGSDGPISPGLTSVKLTWTAANVTSCTLSGGTFNYTPQATNNSTGVMTTSAGTITYTLNCLGPAGNAKDSVTVNYGGDSSVNVDVKGNGSDGPVSVTSGSALSLTWKITGLPAGGACQLVTPTQTYDLGSQTSGTWIFYYGWPDYPTSAGIVYSVTCKSSAGATLGSDSLQASYGTTSYLDVAQANSLASVLTALQQILDSLK